MRRPSAQRFKALIAALLMSFGQQALAPDSRAEDDNPFDASTGYRIARYRTPVEPQVPGGQRVVIEEVDSLIAKGVILVDVLASDGAGLDRATGLWHMAKPHENSPGSTWLPDVGKGRTEPMFESYFKANLAQLTGGDLSRPVLIYCQSDCWMGWNAVKRASSYGYTSIFWYSDGVDGWRDWDRTFAKAEPLPVIVSGGVDKNTFTPGSTPP